MLLKINKKYLPKPKKLYNSMKYLSQVSAIKEYPPLYDIPNSYSAQYEHTICIQDGRK